MTTIESDYAIDRTRQSPCCGVAILLEHRSTRTWGGDRLPLGTLLRCSECEVRI